MFSSELDLFTKRNDEYPVVKRMSQILWTSVWTNGAMKHQCQATSIPYHSFTDGSKSCDGNGTGYVDISGQKFKISEMQV
ncbi:uncharacterized protein KGF55_003386 [Candida pseudojiufengensis]|uniref:uncharacterized protein n=1 Tax=Candida pseudojiufengensis TaxID=497109 RepID=UPI002224524D|nr:uncharacterized protein KGF55_003386 [Candida pseudojiufengensis]KAI5962310.1 hypothetical protein KGF55_003386 [Candida pseudojiufengensis]